MPCDYRLDIVRQCKINWCQGALCYQLDSKMCIAGKSLILVILSVFDICECFRGQCSFLDVGQPLYGGQHELILDGLM